MATSTSPAGSGSDPGAGFRRFRIQSLRFVVEARTAIELPEFKGSALRGGLIEALGRDLGHVHDGPIDRAGCPICDLVATLDETSARGADVPRPFAVQAPLDRGRGYDPGARFEFGLSLFGTAIALFPYLVLGVQRLGEIGFGNRQRAPGRFELAEIWAHNPVTGQAQRLHERGHPTVAAPKLPVDHDQVLARAVASGPRPGSVRLRLVTPLRLVQAGSLVHELTFDALLRRLLRRLTDLAGRFGAGPPDLDYPALLDRARDVRVVEDATRWIDLASHSRRLGRATPIGGHLGEIVFAGDLGPFLPWLIWGELIQVGKDATKGNGRYVIRDVGAAPDRAGEEPSQVEAAD